MKIWKWFKGKVERLNEAYLKRKSQKQFDKALLKYVDGDNT